MRFGTLLRWVGQQIRKTPVQHISAEDVRRLLGTGKMILYDACMPAQWRRGHISGAVYIGFDDRYDVGLLPADRKKMLIFYCESAI